MQQGDHAPCRREIARLTEELNLERSGRQVIIGKKNAEIAYFKTELDALLGEIANQSTTTAQSSAAKSETSPFVTD